MPARKLVDDETLILWHDVYGLSYPQIALESFVRTGYEVGESAVGNAMARLGRTKPRARFLDTVPWKVKGKHNNDHIVQMLRAEHHYLAGEPLPKEALDKLEGWKRERIRNNEVADYDENLPDGFFYVKRLPIDGTGWIRRPAQSILLQCTVPAQKKKKKKRKNRLRPHQEWVPGATPMFSEQP